MARREPPLPCRGCGVEARSLGEGLAVLVGSNACESSRVWLSCNRDAPGGADGADDGGGGGDGDCDFVFSTGRVDGGTDAAVAAVVARRGMLTVPVAAMRCAVRLRAAWYGAVIVEGGDADAVADGTVVRWTGVMLAALAAGLLRPTMWL